MNVLWDYLVPIVLVYNETVANPVFKYGDDYFGTAMIIHLERR